MACIQCLSSEFDVPTHSSHFVAVGGDICHTECSFNRGQPQNIPICNLIANHAPLFAAKIYSFLEDIDEEKFERALNFKYDALYIWGLYIKIRCKKISKKIGPKWMIDYWRDKDLDFLCD